ncbi:serine hydrolase [uncultured Methanoregula sp.]|uniref:serine hydrolase n=1 Tax=uncultured Methanoregula sp. TaxID=1005933 RepID=UPI002AABBE83|nr:serine hydrolase [uncultured Methanoregula sp.]
MNWKIAGLVLAVLICTAGCITSPAPVQSGTPASAYDTPSPLAGPDAAVSKKLDEYMTALAGSGRFSGAVHVARGDTVLLSKGYGMANYEFPVPNTPQTVFPIGSNTKQLTAAAIMKLQEQGRLNVTDPVTWYIPNATRWKNIRIYQLLNHTSGIQSDGAFPLTGPANLALPDIMDRASALPLAFEPGTGYTYSNNGYIALSYIIEKASGMSYDDYLKKNIFLPLGMNSSGQDNARDVFPGRASGYTTMDGRQIHYDLQNIHNSWGAGSVHSTTEDLFRWERAFHTPGTILSPQSTAAMVDNHYGIESGVVKNRTFSGHGGRNFGFISYTLYYPEKDVSIMFLSNHDRTPMVTLTNDLSAIIFGEPYSLPQKIDRREVPLTAAAITGYTGTYAPAWEKSWTITVYPEGNHLMYHSVMPEETVRLFYEGNDTFFVTPESKDAFIFTRDTSGKVDGLKMYTLEGSYDRSEKVS